MERDTAVMEKISRVQLVPELGLEFVAISFTTHNVRMLEWHPDTLFCFNFNSK